MSDLEINDETPISDLRKAYEKQREAAKALASELNSYKQKERQASVAELLKAKGVPAAAAKFYDGEVDETSVSKWVEENAELFPTTSNTNSQTGSAVPDPNLTAAQRVLNATADNGQGTEPVVNNDGRILGDPTEIEKILRTTPRTAEGYQKLVALGLMPKSPNVV